MSASSASPEQGPSPRRIGLFGGSFDPVHRAHVALARTALSSLRLDELRWLPAGQPWQKPRALSAADDRVAMLQLATAGEPRFTIDRREVDRDGPTYTVETVVELAAELPDALLFLVIGQDQHAALHTWKDWRRLVGHIRLAVAQRPGADRWLDDAVREIGYEALPLPPLEISATDIRDRAAAGQDITALVPPEVARYIDSHRLYRASPWS